MQGAGVRGSGFRVWGLGFRLQGLGSSPESQGQTGVFFNEKNTPVRGRFADVLVKTFGRAGTKLGRDGLR